MVNSKLIYKVIGTLLVLEVLLLLVCMGVGIVYQENQLMMFGWPAIGAFVLSVVLKLMGRHAENRMGRRDGYLIVSMTWIVFSLVGMFPFLLGGYETRVAAAFFESMSGFSTTGATIMSDVDHLPHSILFWRSLMHWFGGMGIVFFTIAVLPQMGAGDLKLFSAEATGLKTGKMHPRISTTARWLWSIYVMLTLAGFVSLYLAGMNIFDAANHAMSTISTGGFSTHQDSIAYFNSPLIEYIIILFMFCGGVNFTLLYLFMIKHRWHDVFHDAELRCFVTILLTVVLYIMGVLYFVHGLPLEEAFRKSLFHTLSLQTTTGFTTSNFMDWHPTVWLMLVFVTFTGACAGSTSGGVKCVRILTAYKYVVNEFRHILHPRAVLTVRLNHSSLSSTVGQTIFAFFVAFFILMLLYVMLMVGIGMPVMDAVSMGISTFSNAGPSVGWETCPVDSWGHLSDTALWANSFMMLAGRLEIFSLLLPFVPSFWRDR